MTFLQSYLEHLLVVAHVLAIATPNIQQHGPQRQRQYKLQIQHMDIHSKVTSISLCVYKKVIAIINVLFLWFFSYTLVISILSLALFLQLKQVIIIFSLPLFL